MEKLDKKYPQYQFAKHKWYGTQLHRDLIAQHGPCEIHRKLFLKDYFPDQNRDFSAKKLKLKIRKVRSKCLCRQHAYSSNCRRYGKWCCCLLALVL
jgi:hypothetical protein